MHPSLQTPGRKETCKNQINKASLQGCQVPPNQFQCVERSLFTRVPVCLVINLQQHQSLHPASLRGLTAQRLRRHEGPRELIQTGGEATTQHQRPLGGRVDAAHEETMARQRTFVLSLTLVSANVWLDKLTTCSRSNVQFVGQSSTQDEAR